MLSHNYSLFIMFVGSFFIQYYLMSWIMSNSLVNVTNSLGKVYLSIIMGILMMFLEWLMMATNSKRNLLFWLTVFLFLLLTLFFIYLYRNQVFIGDKEYLNEMMEHHSMAILTSEQILKKTKNQKVQKLAKNIIETQTKEIEEMKGIVEKGIVESI